MPSMRVLVRIYEPLRQMNSNRYLALVCYEHLLTAKYEEGFLRGRRGSATTWIFMANRYLLLATVIVQGVPYSPQVSSLTRHTLKRF